MAFDSKGTLNKVMLIGRLGQDPELKYTPAGAAVVNVSIATDTSWKDQDGNSQDKTEWHRLVFWRKQAEILSQYSKKGDRIYVEGKLMTRSWDDKDSGQKRYITEIQVANMQFLTSKGDRDAASNSSIPEPPEPPAEYSGSDVEQGDDLPF